MDAVRKRPAPFGLALLFALVICPFRGAAQEHALVTGVELQPLAAQVGRLTQALELAGAPLTPDARAALDAALKLETAAEAVAAVQRVLDPLSLVHVQINPESRVKAAAGAAGPVLMEQGWRVFLVKVVNEAGVTAPLACASPNAVEMHDRSDGSAEPEQTISAADVRNRWLDVELFTGHPLGERLSGLKLEYRVIELFSRDRGPREAKLAFDVGQGTQDLGFNSEVNLLFQCEPSVDVRLEVLDDDGEPTTAQFVIRDERGRVYPARSRRLAPDFFFHDQIYRAHGETIRLPPGKFDLAVTRGPEYRTEHRQIAVAPGDAHTEKFQLARWINLADRGWYSGDHHVHAAGCSHYASPTQGVEPADMMRHILGEDLNVGCVLTWGPCWYYQKQFFDGDVSELSTPRHLMRYDVEVSGFPSSHAGHLVLLRVAEDDYPGTKRIEDWPSWDLPVLKWGKEQGGVVGFAHSGWGLYVSATKLPTFEVPPYDGIGANEFIVDVAHDAVDFISTVDTPAVWELSIWYHTLNCGFTTRISGETDFPCIYDNRVGLGRSYVKLPAGTDLSFDTWVQGIRDGRCYVSDGLTHLFDYQINGLAVGDAGAGGRASVLAATKGETLKVAVRAAAMLSDSPPMKRRAQEGGVPAPTDLGPAADLRARPLDEQPYWHVERARIGDTRTVPVELIVNGEVVETKAIEADGRVTEVEFEYTPQRSSWIAVRVFPAAHTNPIFVEVDGEPIRASRRSAKWCLESIDRCWNSKEDAIREAERPAARAAYDAARERYRQIESESFNDAESP